MGTSRVFIILGLIIIGIVSRLIPHPPNFTSMNAFALFSAFYLQNRAWSFFAVFFTLFLSDSLIGFHATMPSVYLSYGLMIIMGHAFREKTVLARLPLVCLFSSALFFILTNFGVWMTDVIYPKTINGLILCYVSAIPFFINQILGDLVYCSLFFTYIYFAEKRGNSLTNECTISLDHNIKSKFF